VREILIAAGIFALLAGVALALQLADPLSMLYLGAILVVGGLAFSTPFAIVYHWKLYRVLGPRGELDKRWLLNPTGQHKHLRDSDRPRVMPWFYAGAFGWGVCVIGCAVLGIAAFMLRSTS